MVSIRRLIVLSVVCIAVLNVNPSFAQVRGIYVTQSTAQNAAKLRHLIRQAKASNINTFVVDTNYRNSRFARNITLLHQNGIRYVARIVVFPHGANYAQARNKKIWEKRWNSAQYAISLGAKEIQLDYIRYRSWRHSSLKHSHQIHKIIKYFKNKLAGSGIKLQVDIFGVVAHRPSNTIGQNALLFSNSVDAFCPMVYPSHYEPFRYYSKRPYETVYNSITKLKQQLGHQSNVKIYAYIEMSNYRYPMGRAKKIKYIQAQMQGAINAGADGWYAWSPNNKYHLLFKLLSNGNIPTKKNIPIKQTYLSKLF